MIKLVLALCVLATVARALPARSLYETSLDAAIPERQHGMMMNAVENGREMAEEDAIEDKERQSFFQDVQDMPEFAYQKNSSEWTDSEKAEFKKWSEPYKKKYEPMMKKMEAIEKELNMSLADLGEMGFGNPVSMLAMYKMMKDMKDLFGDPDDPDDLDLFDLIDHGLGMFYGLTGKCPPEDLDAAAKQGFEAEVQIRKYCFNKYGYFDKIFKESISKPYVVIHDQFKQIHKDVADALKAADKDGYINKKFCKEYVAFYKDENIEMESLKKLEENC